ncbi:cytochrome P450 [Streptomyces racemochromogenes]|uniref:Cytochrome P450 n=1 Tax=Streptomyces racemochromogenes TaxID=67353 RepID=A0ABW7PPJ8_9ACTN
MSPTFPLLDSTLPLLARGYRWAPGLIRRHGGGPAVRTRLMGRPALLLHGPEAVDFFYDEHHVLRHGALPGPVLDTLFGRGAVHTLDGALHRGRKSLFVSLLMADGAVDSLVALAGKHWLRAAEDWRGREVVLFDEAAAVLAGAVCAWAGVPVTEEGARRLAEDCTAMVDGFATAGPRHWKARRARARQEAALAGAVEAVRAAAGPARGGPGVLDAVAGGPGVLDAVAGHRDCDGRLLDPRTAAVELLNILRPTVAVAWFTAFAAHALHRTPRLRAELRTGGAPYARAFAHEVRRFYPFVPFVGGLAARDLRFGPEQVPEGTLVLLDVHGHHRDPGLWTDPHRFDPLRFLGREPGPAELIPQGGGDARTGHRCPGEDITVGLLAALVPALAGLDADVPEQDLRIPLDRIPTRPRSGFVLSVPAGR